MATILVSGLINIETTVAIDGFPIVYEPVRYPFFGVRSTVSGVGYNLARALTILGHEVRLLAMIGRDDDGGRVRRSLAADGISGEFVIDRLEQTPQAAILYDPSGRRMINTDLKDIQETAYPPELFARAIVGCDLAALTTINFSRPFLAEARGRGVPVASDVHAITDLDDPYNADFMRAADILFQSHERLPCSPNEWVKRVQSHYGNGVVVVGMGADGALLGVNTDQELQHVPAVATRPIVSTIGAGDALFSAFIDGTLRGLKPRDSLRRAVVFASYKIGAVGAAEGFLTPAELDALL